MTVGAEVLGDHQVLPNLWLLPLRDVVAMGLWAVGLYRKHNCVARGTVQAEGWEARENGSWGLGFSSQFSALNSMSHFARTKFSSGCGGLI